MKQLTRRGLFGIFGAALVAPKIQAKQTLSKTTIFITKRVIKPIASRMLKASWTVELAQDLKVIHGLDTDVELVNICTEEVQSELKRKYGMRPDENLTREITEEALQEIKVLRRVA